MQEYWTDLIAFAHKFNAFIVSAVFFDREINLLFDLTEI